MAAGIALLGPLAVNGDAGAGPGTLPPRDRVVLSALAVRPGAVVSAERLADALWGERPPASWNKIVPGCVMRLRRVLGPDAIETTGGGYRLIVPADKVDSQRFEALVGRGRELLTLGEPERASHQLAEALALWRGRALLELSEWEPGRIEAARLEELRLDAEEDYIEARLQSGQHREVLAEAQARVAEAPVRERRWALLALARYQAGRQGEALRTLRRARSVLVAELGLDPGPELIALEQAILRQDPSLSAGMTHAEASGTCPYLGLVPYDVSDADDFFGRDAAVTECLERLATHGVLAVVGPSGCGKSSIVRAGVTAALERQGQRVCVSTPGSHPMETLSGLVANGDTVLVMDQCEEALTMCSDGEEQARFFDSLAARAEGCPLVVAIRADRLGDVAAHPTFASLVQRGFVLVGGMTEAELLAAIEGPARRAGLLLEPGLVDVLVHEVEGEPGALPLLSHALRRTWHEREGRTLTVAGYRKTGGIREAVARTAEELYQRLPAEQRPVLRDLLLRLVTPSTDGEVVRIRASRRTLVTVVGDQELIERLITARLVTSDGDIIELAHEALARAWPRLRGWLDDDVEGHRIARHLANAADTWDTMGRPDSELYRGPRLHQALEWRGGARRALGATEEAFLEASAALAAVERRSAEEQARRQLRTNRRLRGLLTGVAVLLVAALVAGLLAWRQAERADRATTAADAGRVAALARNVAEDDRALLLAAESVRLESSPETRSSLLAALARRPELIASTSGPASLVTLDVNSDTGRLATGGVNVVLHEAATLKGLGSADRLARDVAFHPDGRQLAVAVDDLDDPRPIQLLDADTLRALAVQLGDAPAPPAQASDLNYSSDGRFLSALFRHYGRGSDGTEASVEEVVVWDTAAPQRPVLRIDLSASAAALSPDGQQIYVDAWRRQRRTIDVYDATTGRIVRSTHEPIRTQNIANPDDTADLLEVSPSGAFLAVGDGGDLLLLDAATLAVRHRLGGSSGAVQAVEFSHDGTMVAVGADDGTVIIWEVVDGTRRSELPGGGAGVADLAFSPDDKIVYAAADRLRAWDLHGGRRLVRSLVEQVSRRDFSSRVVPAPGGEALAYFQSAAPGDRHSVIQFRDVATGRLGQRIETGHDNLAAAWRPPDAGQFAAADVDGFVRVWNWRDGELVTERKLAQGPIAGIAYRDDGRRMVVAERSGSLIQVDADTLAPVGDRIPVGGVVQDVVAIPDSTTVLVLLSGHDYALVDLTDGTEVDLELTVDPATVGISPDGSRLAVGGAGGHVGVADLQSGDWIRPPSDGHEGWVQRVAYSPDGRLLASAGNDGQVKVWDGRSGEPLGSITPGSPNVWATVEFLPDAHTIIVGTRDGAVYTWDTRVEHWIDFACRVTGRSLTGVEWRTAFGDRNYRETCPQGGG